MKRLLACMRDGRGAAAVEMALVVPLLMTLAFGPIEVGNYFMNEHALIKGVRDGATYAAHQDISNYDCSAPGDVPPTLKTKIQNMVRSGQVAGGTDRLANWGSAGTVFTATFKCVTKAKDNSALSGIYALNDGNVPVVIITASVPYRSVLASIGIPTANLKLNAGQEAVVMGI